MTSSQHHTVASAFEADSVTFRSGIVRTSVTLEAGDTAENPASTKQVIHGPAVVTYDRYPDGGIDALVEEA